MQLPSGWPCICSAGTTVCAVLQVCSGRTGHTEAVQVTYDEDQASAGGRFIKSPVIQQHIYLRHRMSHGVLAYKHANNCMLVSMSCRRYLTAA